MPGADRSVNEHNQEKKEKKRAREATSPPLVPKAQKLLEELRIRQEQRKCQEGNRYEIKCLNETEVLIGGELQPTITEVSRLDASSQ